MTQEFFGPWHIEIVAAPYPGLPIPPLKLVITSSDNADGTLPQQQWPDSIDVTGQRWTLATFLANDTPPLWRPYALHKTTQFTRDNGLQITLGGRSPMFVCTSRDELLSPPAEPNPYDFTIPERQG